MSEGADEEKPGDKPYEPTQKRLEDARKRGEVPRSADLAAAAAYGGLLATALAVGPLSLAETGRALAAMIARPHELADSLFRSAAAPVGDILRAVLVPLLPWFLLPALLAVAVLAVQGAFSASVEKLAPRLDRISPLAVARNKFGRDGLFEFAKSTVKLGVLSLVLGVFVFSELPAMLTSAAFEPAGATAVLLAMSVRFLALVFLLALSVGVVDYFWQRAEHLRKHRMSRKELVDESRESEGDPYLKGRRRERATELATRQMMAEVPTADVVIVNPTHFAVALRWDRSRGSAPRCVAKGRDHVAQSIRAAAAAAGVPVRSDPATARALFATVALGEEIRPEHYRAVAAAIRFADALRKRARGGTDAPR